MRSVPVAILVLSLSACREPEGAITPTVGPITESVYASGVVKARGQYQVHPTVTGMVQALFVEEGDTVKAGQPLLLIDDRGSSASARASLAQLNLLETNVREDGPVLTQLREAVVQARDRFRLDSLNYARQRALWDKQVGSRNELDQRELAYTTSQAALARAEKALDETRSRLRTELDVARSNAAISLAGQDDRTLRSLIDGLVYDLMIEAGELATPQQPVAVIGSVTDLYLELEVDEFDIRQVQPGQRVFVTLDSYAGTAFEAEVVRIVPLMDQRSRTFKVEARFTQPPPRLYPNLTAEANIVLRTKKDALTIPAAYLLPGDQVVLSSGERVSVTTGVRDLERVEVLDGIDMNTTIMQP